MRKLKILSLCDGISLGKIAFDKLKIPIEYHAIENKELTRKISNYNFNANFDSTTKGIIRWANDVDEVTLRLIKKHGPFDWVIMGPTCKSVSKASNGPGLVGASRVLFQCIKIRDWVLKCNPKAKFLIENVKMQDKYYADFCQVIGSDATLIDSALVSGQERLRYYWTNFNLTLPKDKKIMLNDILDSDAKYGVGWSKSGRYKDKKGKRYNGPGPGRTYFVEDRFKPINKAHTLMTGKHCRGQSSHTRVYLTKNKYRFLNVNECKRLQTIPKKFSFDCVSDKKAFESIGDGWTIDIIKHVIKCGVL